MRTGGNAMFDPVITKPRSAACGGFGRWLTSDDRCGQQARARVLLTKTRGRRHRSRLSRNSPAPQTKKVSLTGVGRLICLWWILLASFLSSARHMAARTRSRTDWQMPEQHFRNFMFTYRLQSQGGNWMGFIASHSHVHMSIIPQVSAHNGLLVVGLLTSGYKGLGR